MAEQKRVLHFTLGPVQSFVEQARRTRDLWAGSFLLSYLSGHAMKAVIEAGGKVVFPAVQHENGEPEDELLRAILGESHGNPQIGSLPNRFKAEVPGGFDPRQCETAVWSAWERIADAVWSEWVVRVAARGRDTQAIWERQVSSFWDMAWVMGESEDPKTDGPWLDQRKNWRTYQPSIEGGDHCTLMGDWQELSGYVRAKEVKAQDAFWNALRNNLKALDLGEHERLCAIALIKRLYPRLSNQALGWELKVNNWPSTPYMAAVPWLKEAYPTQEAREYLQSVEDARLDWAFGEYSTNLAGLEGAGRFAKLDGNFFHKTALENKNASPGLTDEQRHDLLSKLQALNKAVGHPASPFYALLLMDGDRLGQLLQEPDGQERASQALAHFTEQVESIIAKHSGKTIYAGGDDVMAFLPLDGALEAASELHQHYREAFDRKPDATISGAIVFAHYNLSLRAVLDEAHHQLDNIAKEQNGRDSLAVSVLTGSGRTVQWVSSWEEKITPKPIPLIVKELSETFDEQFASKFFYNVRQRFEVLTQRESYQLIEGLDAFRLLVAEYQKSREHKASPREAEESVGQLLRVCRIRKNSEEAIKTLNINGALLVRFLATKGKGVER